MSRARLDGPYVRGVGRDHSLATSATVASRCAWCGRARGVSHIEFCTVLEFDRAVRAWRIDDPKREGLRRIALPGHVDCGPNVGFAILLCDVATHSVAVWDAILHGTPWYSPWVRDALIDAVLLYVPLRDRRSFAVEYFGGPRDGEHEVRAWDFLTRGHRDGYVARAGESGNVRMKWAPEVA